MQQAGLDLTHKKPKIICRSKMLIKDKLKTKSKMSNDKIVKVLLSKSMKRRKNFKKIAFQKIFCRKIGL